MGRRRARRRDWHSGVGGVVVNPTTRAITGGITFSGLTGAPTGAHIHRPNDTTNIAVSRIDTGEPTTLRRILLRTTLTAYPCGLR